MRHQLADAPLRNAVVKAYSDLVAFGKAPAKSADEIWTGTLVYYKEAIIVAEVLTENQINDELNRIIQQNSTSCPQCVAFAQCGLNSVTCAADALDRLGDWLGNNDSAITDLQTSISNGLGTLQNQVRSAATNIKNVLSGKKSFFLADNCTVEGLTGVSTIADLQNTLSNNMYARICPIRTSYFSNPSDYYREINFCSFNESLGYFLDKTLSSIPGAQKPVYNGAITSEDFQIAISKAIISKNGGDSWFNVHLQGVKALLLKNIDLRAGNTNNQRFIDEISTRLVNKDPNNLFYEYLKNGATDSLARKLINLCDSQSADVQREHWLWEQAPELIMTPDRLSGRMHWDCVFVANLILRDSGTVIPTSNAEEQEAFNQYIMPILIATSNLTL